MITPENFRSFAADCEAMATVARSPESKATWGQLAARWNQCAEIAERNLFATTWNKSFFDWNKSFFDYVIRADIGRALMAHYDHQLEAQPIPRRLDDLLNKIDEREDRQRPPRNE
jgi:hypothetical protein